ncbi:oligopeptide/dipeptide ABC transporter, ATPase subunit [Desulfofarcimen acetoxidans DSM 771]|uniref:Oligopeptide/dipeptide ABC transporter, ATPase subunit n=1 Tax=Desulfofarcimen acetoxidans (strain ATCC 49208 / DSM 771 / KCTC 5769 / VKM B-1644 / 5575) TaxID=485916 RepID=C8W4W9_DESAS|nr:ABC transporter ATP-binding protein [Desulfofarcimen acetoxidans]ACV61321.1 oligopeptide/dipeptide ABC transporter, ATPase subunit [Desulfofarcimen acetoxidans DSM 771]
MILLKVANLKKKYNTSFGHFSAAKEIVYAVEDISFSLRQGETLALAGESGCGKSTLARLILRLEEPTGGKIIFAGEDITNLSGKKLRHIRKNMQIVFQDSSSSLNQLQTVGASIEEPLNNFQIRTPKDRKQRVEELMEMVGIDRGYINKYPHQLSGGQRQRVSLARALAITPRLLVLDEPVSSLDVSIQAQILNLLENLKKEYNLTYLFISHDLAVISQISDRIAIMYLGSIIEIIRCEDLLAEAVHPYTTDLLASVPVPDPRQRKDRRKTLMGEPPNPLNPPAGCRFHPRCRLAWQVCRQEKPTLRLIENEHMVACHLYGNR